MYIVWKASDGVAITSYLSSTQITTPVVSGIAVSQSIAALAITGTP